MATTKQKLNNTHVAKEDKTLVLVAEKRLKENRIRLSHDEVWVTKEKRI